MASGGSEKSFVLTASHTSRSSKTVVVSSKSEGISFYSVASGRFITSIILSLVITSSIIL